MVRLNSTPDYYKVRIEVLPSTKIEIEADKIIQGLIEHNNMFGYGDLTPYYYNALAYLIRCGCKEDFASDVKKAINNLEMMLEIHSHYETVKV